MYTYAHFPTAQVRAAAQRSMQLLMEHFSEGDLESYVCPVLEKLASEEMEEEYRTEAVAVCMRVVVGCVLRLLTHALPWWAE